ncbi:hypothetical protein BFR04_00535 [Gaetbulibacter sp. 4G1]|nr:hypothetical protein [Gaetbulibacter sp. 4G1]PIA79372.1 hypothetical protein BFR04_00535 [Gaetbulibacter sp. 4G1]
MLFCINLTYAQTKSDVLIKQLENTPDKSQYLKILDTLTKELIRHNNPQQVKYLNEYVSLSKALGDYDAAASKSRFIIQQHIFKGDNKKAFTLIDSMLSYKRKFTNPNSEAHLLLKRGGVHYAELDYTSAIKDYKASIPLFLESKDSIYVADAYYFLAGSYSNNGEFVDAVLSFENAYKLYFELKDFDYIFHVGYGLILLYDQNGLEEEAQKKRDELMAISIEKDDCVETGLLHINYATSLLKRDKLSSCYKFMELAREEIEPCPVEDDYYAQGNPLLLENLYCLYHIKLGNLEKAKTYLDKAIFLENKLGHNVYRMKLYFTKAKYYQMIGDFDKALNIALEYKNQISNDNNHNRIEIEKLLGELYRSNNDFKRADKQMQLYTKLKDSIYKASTANSFAYHQARFEAKEKGKKVLELMADNAEASQKHKTLWVLFFSLLGIAITAVFVIWLKSKLVCNRLKTIISHKQTILTEFTSQMLNKNEEQKLLSGGLEQLKKEVEKEEGTVDIKQMESLLSSKILTQDDWKCFKHRFTSMFPDFFIKLKTKNILLTDSETRLLALEHLKLTNDEIAKMLGISTRSVITSRYRLRRKMDIPKGVSVLEYLEL